MTMKNKKRKPAPKTHERLVSTKDKELMMSVLIRNPDAFLAVKDVLTPEIESFGEADRGIFMAWKIACDYYDETGELPDSVLMFAAVQQAIDDDPEFLTEIERDELESWLATAYDPKEWDKPITKAESYCRFAIKVAKRYMREQLAFKVQQEIVGQGRMVVNTSGFLDDKRTLSDRIESVGALETGDFFTDEWHKDGGIKMFSTGIGVFDKILGGGHAPGECYGLMGPFGSCKTTYAVMLACQAAEEASIRSATNPKDDYYAILVTYEARLENELRLRAMSFYGQIARSSLEHMGPAGKAALSTNKDPNSLKGYEKRVAWNRERIKQGKKLLGEQERFDKATAVLKERLIAIDLTGYNKARRGQGFGYLPEIARLIREEMRKKGKRAKPIAIIIDYVGIMAKRYMSANGIDRSELRHYIGEVPMLARNTLADQFNCPVWLLHQLSGQANKKGPRGFYDHTDAAECASFGENLDFAIVIGKPTEPSGLCQMVNSKHRRTGSTPIYVVQIQGAMNRVVFQPGKYIIDPVTRTIRLATESQQTAPGPSGGSHTLSGSPDEAVSVGGLGTSSV